MKKTSFSVIILALIFATTNCVSSPKSDTPVVIPVTSHTSPIITSTNSATSIPTSTAIPSPTWTPIPTLSSTEAELMVASLLESNGGCKLPCWWGAIPGQTSWDEVEQFLNMFITRVEQGQAGTSLEDDGDHFYTNYSAEYIVLGQASKGRILYDVRDGVIVGISVDPPGNEFSYQLHQLLSSYGQPQAVYILTYPNVPFEILPFRILLIFVKRKSQIFLKIRGKMPIF